MEDINFTENTLTIDLSNLCLCCTSVGYKPKIERSLGMPSLDINYIKQEKWFLKFVGNCFINNSPPISLKIIVNRHDTWQSLLKSAVLEKYSDNNIRFIYVGDDIVTKFKNRWG